ncbi:FAD linked oxidase domain-containing protein [Alicycliphilus sp. B1]|nr:FAD linked oxidase domain-containing protein [Alicycliphilus sp. B1]
MTVHNVLRVRGFTMEGEPVTFGSEALDAPGYDLLAAVIGSEGMLAVALEATVRLIPSPQLARCIMASFDDVRKAGDAVAAVIAAGIIPAGLEMMDKPMTAAVEDFVKAGYDLTAEAILLCESDGTPEEVEEEIARMSEVLRGAGATAISVSGSEEERMRFWSGRKNAFPASGRISPDYMCMDSTIPRKRLADILLAIQQMEKKYGLRCCNVFHAGDGNLHPLILFDANDPDQLHRCELFGADILETSVAMGGTVTGEHGVGVEKLNSMCTQFTVEENAQMMASSTRSTRPACSTPARSSRRSTAAPSTGRCWCAADGSATPACRAFKQNQPLVLASQTLSAIETGAHPPSSRAQSAPACEMVNSTSPISPPTSVPVDADVLQVAADVLLHQVRHLLRVPALHRGTDVLGHRLRHVGRGTWRAQSSSRTFRRTRSAASPASDMPSHWPISATRRESSESSRARSSRSERRRPAHRSRT